MARGNFTQLCNFNLNLNGAKIPGTDYNISNVSLLGTNDIRLSPILTCDPKSGLGHNQYVNPNCFAMPNQIGQNGPTILPAIYGPGFFNWDMGLFKNFQFSENRKLQIRFNGYNFLNHPLWSTGARTSWLRCLAKTVGMPAPAIGVASLAGGITVEGPPELDRSFAFDVLRFWNLRQGRKNG